MDFFHSYYFLFHLRFFFFFGVVQFIKNVAMYESSVNSDGATMLTGTSQLEVPVFEHQS